MWNRTKRIAVLAWLAAVASPAVAELPETPDMFDIWMDRVVQVQVMDRQAGSKSGLGSGFFAGEPGWIVTNYHVIAELVNEPSRYDARYLAGDQIEGDLELVTVDVVHDLAVLRTDGLERTPLAVDTTPPVQGLRLWSMGYPYDIGLTIVEGTYNGPRRKSMHERLHFTGSINPGMSGGPTLDGNGAVVGVNTSGAGNQVSFLVPVKYVRKLLDDARSMVAAAGSDASDDAPESGVELDARVARQLLDNQQLLVDRLLGRPLPVTHLNGYSVPGDLDTFINCWGNSEFSESDRMDTVTYQCRSQDDVFLSNTQSTAVIQYQHELLSTEDLNALQFWSQIESRATYPRVSLAGDEDTVSNYHCQSGFIDNGGLPMKVTYCVRAFRKLDNLYDVFVSATSLVKGREALQSTLVLGGFSWDNLERFVSEFLGAFQWAP